MLGFLILLSTYLLHLSADKWYSTSYHHDLSHWLTLPPESTHHILSRSYLASSTSYSHFLFPFFNSTRDVITVTSSGFLYLGTFSSTPQTGTAGYIAPLMADFQPGSNPAPAISILALDTVFAVEWRDVQLDQGTELSAFFTFQCQLYPNGTILFLYQNLSVPLSSLSSSNHPVDVGLRAATSPKVPEIPSILEELPLNTSKVLPGVTVTISPNVTGCCGNNKELRGW